MGAETPVGSQVKAAAFALLALLLAPVPAAAERYAIIVSGASGGPEFEAQYARWTADLAAVLAGRMRLDPARIITLADGDDERMRSTAANVRRAFATVRAGMAQDDLLFVFLIGHGTFDGVDAKFNLVGPDLESAEWLELVGGVAGQLVLVNTTAGSFAFIERLSGPRRVIISATDSAAQKYDTVLAQYFIEALAGDEADIDKNGRVSIWEAFAAATAGVRRHYQQLGQLSTERALLDDDGDGRGAEAAALGADGSLASRTYLDAPRADAAPTDEVLLQLLQTRARLETEVDELRLRRTFMPPADYLQEFERLMIELARVARDIRGRVKS